MTIPITATTPITCGSCGHVDGIDEFDCGGLPDALAFCPKCLAIIEVISGAVVPDDDMELRSGEV